MNHTPGPWYRSDATSMISDGSNFIVASHGVAHPPRHEIDATSEEHRANGYLIAAAPFLLEAIKQLIAEIEGNPVTASEFYANTSDELQALIDARDAIRSAETGFAPPPY